MALRDAEQDDEEVLRAEDEAIRDADKPIEEPGVRVTGIPKLIEDVFDGKPTPVQREGEG